jgi:hypothetical protein
MGIRISGEGFLDCGMPDAELQNSANSFSGFSRIAGHDFAGGTLRLSRQRSTKLSRCVHPQDKQDWLAPKGLRERVKKDNRWLSLECSQ